MAPKRAFPIRDPPAKSHLHHRLSAEQAVDEVMFANRKKPTCSSSWNPLEVHLFEICEHVCADHIPLSYFLNTAPMDDADRTHAFPDGLGIQALHTERGVAQHFPAFNG